MNHVHHLEVWGRSRMAGPTERILKGAVTVGKRWIETIKWRTWVRSFLVALALINMTSCTAGNAFRDDSHYVRLGPRTGYYIVRPGSDLSRQLGFENAPSIDTADPYRHGYGADALAFRFNRAGILAVPPAYIVQATPNDFYTRRLGSLIRGKSNARDVQTFFGRSDHTEKQADGFIEYYVIEVYNPFEDRSNGRR